MCIRDRNVPVVATEDKNLAEKINQTALESFIDEKCIYTPGYTIKLSEFFDKFLDWVEPNEVHRWTKIRVGREIPPIYPKARIHETGQHHFGNITWSGAGNAELEKRKKLIVKGDYLEVSSD